MPIDFAAVAERFSARLEFESYRAVRAQRGIEKVLKKRRDAAKAVELATRGFPIVLFYGGAVTMKVTPSQYGAMGLVAPAPSFLDQLAAGGLGFLGGIRETVAPFTSESQQGALGRFAGSIDSALADVEASLDRFEGPFSEMFDPRRRTGSDLFGLAALAFRALVEASRRGGEIEVFTAQIGGALGILGEEPAAPSGTPVPARSVGEQLDVAALEIVGGVTILGTLPEMVAVLLEGVALRIRLSTLEQLESIERIVLDLRASALRTSFLGLTTWADRAYDIVSAVHEIVGANISFTLRFWRALGTEFATSMRTFAIGITVSLRGWVTFLRAIPGLLEAIVRFDLTELLRSKLGRFVGAIPSFTLADTLDEDARRVNVGLGRRLMLALWAAERLLIRARRAAWPFGRATFDGYQRQLDRARWLVRELFPGTTSLGPAPSADIPSEPPPFVFSSRVPDLYETLFGGGRAARLTGIIDGFGTSLQRGLGDTLRHARDGLNDLAGEFGKAGADAARFRGGARLERIGEQATTLADRVFGPEVRGEQERLRTRPRDALAEAFEGWLAHGGFALIGAVIPAFVAEVARHWREQVATGEEPTAPLTATSPHILRRRAVLGRVVMPRLTLRASPAREPDVALADQVAELFAGAVAGAYETGRRRVAELAAVAGP